MKSIDLYCSRLVFFLALLLYNSCAASGPFEEMKDLPVAFQGRFRSLEPAARLWLYDFYHLQNIKKEHLPLFQIKGSSALELNWKVHMLGPNFMDNAPLFWIHYAEVKKILNLDLAQTRFSYRELIRAIFENKASNLRMMQTILPYEYAKNYLSPNNRSRSNKLELQSLSPGLWVGLHNGTLIVTSAPKSPPWNFLKIDFPLTTGHIDLEYIEKKSKLYSEEILQLVHHLQVYKELTPNFTTSISKNSDIQNILRNAGSTLKMLPSKNYPGEWLSLHALDTQVADGENQQSIDIGNFTTFSDDHFQKLREAYKDLKVNATKYFQNESQDSILEKSVNHFYHTYKEAYASIIDQPYRKAINKQLYYPSPSQLHMETLYYRLPLIELSLLAYCLTLILFLIGYTTKRDFIFHWALGFLTLGLLVHTLILVMRCFVLERPPVSNMFETVIYVPWIAMLLGLSLFATLRNYIILVAATGASAGLLILLKLTDVDARMENVQAVLDSQYWLIVHVLMIVASYGVFIVCGLLAHAYLIACALHRQERPSGQFIAKCILQTMYIGIVLLIPGTILGGVWAAESWGRFWDWDPKESWAFISACIYVLIIHAYTFRKIHDYGLAVGAIIGLMAVSFTWYGVNYILGTGLHSYGFGKGGEVYYYGYLIFESLFLILISLITRGKDRLIDWPAR